MPVADRSARLADEPAKPRKKRRPNVPELMGAKEVAEELDVQVSNLDRVPRLPEAVQELSRGRIWIAEEIREFAELRRSRNQT